LLTNVARSEARSWAICRAAIERDADQSHVQAARIGDVRQAHERGYAREARKFEGVDGHRIGLGQVFALSNICRSFFHFDWLAKLAGNVFIDASRSLCESLDITWKHVQATLNRGRASGDRPGNDEFRERVGNFGVTVTRQS
jgi:hypothetical protein